ncbi:hypothetical protein NDU88_006591 [Pleurodeles waltl]|uniref:Uncharacterized protein n=1 Tax=Pleurodeles waltl TaxID=8319 RepID=A0AAV7PLF2_PLEWA|nr:hypothetical protein NDU88_006591 [Pleurodeles waltl]
MPPKKTSAQKGNGRDPELSQLLRLVLEKLGSEDTSEGSECPEMVGGKVRGSRPKQSHVAPSAAFTPVKRRRNGKAQVPATIVLMSPAAVPATIVLSPPAAASLPGQLIAPLPRPRPQCHPRASSSYHGLHGSSRRGYRSGPS